jgi:hypothetical protein
MLLLLVLVACQQTLTPAENAAKDRAECQAEATQKSGFEQCLAARGESSS